MTVGIGPQRNVAFVVRNLSLGGIPRVVIEICAAWSKQHPQDRVHLVLLDDHGRHYDTPEKVTEHDLTRLLNDIPGKLVRLGNKILPNLCSVFTMGRNTRALNLWARNLELQSGLPVDIVLCGYGAISCFSPRRLKNCLCVGHNLYGDMLRERTGRLASLNRRLLRRVLNGARVFAISTPIREALRHDIGVTVEDTVLYNPIDVNRILQLSSEAEPKQFDGPHILYLGRLSPEKNVDLIIRAFGGMQTDASPVLVIAGAGHERAQLERLAAEQQRPVRFLGPLKNPYPVLSTASALVLASDFEGMPTVLLEARALGTPIVTTAAGGASTEAIEGYDMAVLVPDKKPASLSEALAAVLALSDAPRRPDPLPGFTTEACIARYREALHAAPK